jgi:hypothetical protein
MIMHARRVLAVSTLTCSSPMARPRTRCATLGAMSRLEQWERRTAPLLTALAAVALIALVLEAAFDARTIVGSAVEYIAWALFTGDYAVRLYLAHDRWRFIREHPLDLAAVALPTLRTVRLVASIARVSALARRGLGERVLTTTVLVATTVMVAAAALGLEAERDAAGRDDHDLRRRGVVGTDHGDHGGIWRPVSDHRGGPCHRRRSHGCRHRGDGAVTAAIATRLIRDTPNSETEPATAEQLRQLEREVARLVALLKAERRDSSRGQR